MASNSKGQAIELSTFCKYRKNEVIGSKTEKSNGKTMMVSIWFKLCSKHKSVILSNPLCKGSARKAIESYVNGTNFDSSNSSDSDSSSEFELDLDELQQ